MLDMRGVVTFADYFVICSGTSSRQIRTIVEEVEKAMREQLGGGKVIRIEEPIYGGANGALKIAHDMPAEFWEQLK